MFEDYSSCVVLEHFARCTSVTMLARVLMVCWSGKMTFSLTTAAVDHRSSVNRDHTLGYKYAFLISLSTRALPSPLPSKQVAEVAGVDGVDDDGDILPVVAKPFPPEKRSDGRRMRHSYYSCCSFR